MTLKELEAKIKEYKAEVKKTGIERPLTDEEIDEIGGSIHNMPLKYRDAITLSLQNEHGSFEKLPLLIRNYLGAFALKQFRERFNGNPSLENEEVRKYLDKNLMNAALRAGISAEKSQESTRDMATALDTYMNAGLMKKTMQAPSEQAKGNLLNFLDESKVNEMVARNMERQLVMAKAMLLAQLGKYEVIDKNGISHELDVPVYETLVHGNRTNFVLPRGESSGSVIDAFMGEDGGAGAGIEKRTAATHSVKRRSIGNSGAVRSDTKELRTYNPFRVFGNQYGMDIAVGGIGENGPNKRIVTGNGEAGHMYMRAERGDAKHCGSLLIGIEGSAPGKDNYIGHSHGIRAKKAKQSAFLADKSIVGNKIGGRQIDLSGISAEALASILNKFTENYRALQHDPAQREKLSGLNDKLMGKQMTPEALVEMLASLNISGKDIEDAVSQARAGYIGRIGEKALSRDEFTRSIRAGFSQERACKLAEARFAYARELLESDSAEAEADSLELASGAIKELMLTHETRSAWWKIRHPIKNYRENKTISDLMTRLKENFEAEAIASAFGFYDNTFALNWGEELSYDSRTVKFVKEAEGSKLFGPSENKLPRAFEKVRADIRDKISTKVIAEQEQTAMREELAQYEPERFKDSELGLPKDPVGEYTENLVKMMRQPIVVNEENEANKSVDVDESVEIIPEQPAITNQKEF